MATTSTRGSPTRTARSGRSRSRRRRCCGPCYRRCSRNRCKLAVHREMKETQVTTLVVAKGGPKFKETDPAVEHPDGQPLPFGGVAVRNKDGMHFYGTSMAALASFLSSLANQGHPVQDKTGLTGQYDLTFSAPADFSDPGIP